MISKYKCLWVSFSNNFLKSQRNFLQRKHAKNFKGKGECHDPCPLPATPTWTISLLQTLVSSFRLCTLDTIVPSPLCWPAGRHNKRVTTPFATLHSLRLPAVASRYAASKPPLIFSVWHRGPTGIHNLELWKPMSIFQATTLANQCVTWRYNMMPNMKSNFTFAHHPMTAEY